MRKEEHNCVQIHFLLSFVEYKNPYCSVVESAFSRSETNELEFVDMKSCIQKHCVLFFSVIIIYQCRKKHTERQRQADKKKHTHRNESLMCCPVYFCCCFYCCYGCCSSVAKIFFALVHTHIYTESHSGRFLAHYSVCVGDCFADFGCQYCS